MGIEVTTTQQYVYRGRMINVRVDAVRLANGTVAQREIVEHRDAVAVVARDQDDNVLLVRQFRLATGQELLELPAGNMDGDESPEEAARRELAEETGLTASTLRWLAGFYTSPGFCSEYVHIFLATDLRPMAATADADEDISVISLPLADAIAMIRAGQLRDAKTITGLLLATAA